MMVESRDERTRRRRYTVLYGCMIVCAVLSSLAGVAAARHYAAIAHDQNVQLVAQEHVTCVANRTFLKLLNQSVARQRRSLKVDPPAKRKIDRTAIRQLQTLIDGYGPAVEFCAEKT